MEQDLAMTKTGLIFVRTAAERKVCNLARLLTKQGIVHKVLNQE